MKKLISLFLFAAVCGFASWAYDFSAVNAKGDTIWYKITSDSMPYKVEVTFRSSSIFWYVPLADVDRYADTVAIPSAVTYNGNTYAVTAIGSNAFYGCARLTSVTIPSTVTSIGWGAFAYCTGLTSIRILSFVTSISSNAFAGCTGLTSISIPASVTSIGSNVFSYVRNVAYRNNAERSPRGALSVNGVVVGYLVYADDLKSYLLGCSSAAPTVFIPSSVTAIGNNAFYGCTGYTSIYIPHSVNSISSSAFYRMKNVIYHGNASGSPWGALSVNGVVDGYLVYADSAKTHLLGCSSAAHSVTIPSSVTAIGDWAFSGCIGLTSITIPSSVTAIGKGAFFGCTGLTSVAIPSSVTAIGDSAFSECVSLTSIALPSSVTTIGTRVFNRCVSLASVSLPSSITSIGDSAFAYCTGLTSIAIPASVTAIGEGAFHYCKSLTSITIPASVTAIGQGVFNSCTGLTSASIPSSITTVSDSLFYNCWSLTSVALPSSITYIGDEAFRGCTSLTSMVLPDSLRAIGEYVFGDCTGLISVAIPPSDTAIGWGAFDECTSLASITIPASIIIIGVHAFRYCTGLTEVNFNATACKTAGRSPFPPYEDMHAFDCCRSLSTFNIGNNVTVLPDYLCYGLSGLTSITIPSSVTAIGQNVFAKCTGLTEVNFNATACKTSTSTTFSKCRSLSTFNIGDSVTMLPDYLCCYMTGLTSVAIPPSVTAIGKSAFYGCTGLTSINIPNSVLSIGKSAFYDCTGLTSLRVGRAVDSIGEKAFYNSGLTSLTSLNPEPPTCGNGVFDGVDKHAPLHVQTGAILSYAAATGWRDFFNIMDDADTTDVGVTFAENADELQLTVRDGEIVVRNGNGAAVQVYNVAGVLIYSGRPQGEQRIPVPQAGVYLVKAGHAAAKKVMVIR